MYITVHCIFMLFTYFFSFFKKFDLFTYFRQGEGMEKDRERNINMWLFLAYRLLGTWPATQAGALTGNQTSYPLVRTPVLSPLSHTNQGVHCIFN